MSAGHQNEFEQRLHQLQGIRPQSRAAAPITEPKPQIPQAVSSAPAPAVVAPSFPIHSFPGRDCNSPFSEALADASPAHGLPNRHSPAADLKSQLRPPQTASRIAAPSDSTEHSPIIVAKLRSFTANFSPDLSRALASGRLLFQIVGIAGYIGYFAGMHWLMRIVSATLIAGGWYAIYRLKNEFSSQR